MQHKISHEFELEATDMIFVTPHQVSQTISIHTFGVSINLRKEHIPILEKAIQQLKTMPEVIEEEIEQPIEEAIKQPEIKSDYSELLGF